MKDRERKEVNINRSSLCPRQLGIKVTCLLIFLPHDSIRAIRILFFISPLRLSAHWLIYICCSPCLHNWSKAILVMFAWPNHNSSLFPAHPSCLHSASWAYLISSHGLWSLLPSHSSGWHLPQCLLNHQDQLHGLPLSIHESVSPAISSSIGEGVFYLRITRIVKHPAPST